MCQLFAFCVWLLLLEMKLTSKRNDHLIPCARWLLTLIRALKYASWNKAYWTKLVHFWMLSTLLLHAYICLLVGWSAGLAFHYTQQWGWLESWPTAQPLSFSTGLPRNLCVLPVASKCSAGPLLASKKLNAFKVTRMVFQWNADCV